MKKYFSTAQLIISLFVILTLIFSSFSDAYAVPPVDSYARFAGNLDAGRFVLYPEEVVRTGEFGSILLIAGAAALLGLAFSGCGGPQDVGEIDYETEFDPDVASELVEERLCDPQDALLLTSFEVEGVNILDDLINEAMLAENVVFERYLPTFLGGALFTATRAFFGSVLDDEGNLVPGSKVGFGVFETDCGIRYFSPITFTEDISVFNFIESVKWDLSPVIPESSSGLFKVEGIALLSFDQLPVIINNMLEFNAIESTFMFSSDISGCPDGFVGKFSFDARLINKNANPISNLLGNVVTLTNGNLLQSPAAGPGGEGARFIVPKEGAYEDGVLSQWEFVDVLFSICLKERQSFSFFVDLFGVVE